MDQGCVILKAAGAGEILPDGQIRLAGIRRALTWRPRDGARCAIDALRAGVALQPHATGAELPSGLGPAGLANRLLHGGQASLAVALGDEKWAVLTAYRPGRPAEPGAGPWRIAAGASLSFLPDGARLAAARSGVACAFPAGPWLAGLFQPLDPAAPLVLALAMAGLAGEAGALPSGWTAHEMEVHAQGAEMAGAAEADYPDPPVERPAPALPGMQPLANATILARRVSRRQHDPARPLPLATLRTVLHGALADLGPAPGAEEARRRPYPTAGARQGLSWYLVAGRVEGLAPGLHLWQPRSSSLAFLGEGGGRMLADAAAAWGDPGHLPQALLIGALDIRRLAPRYPGQGYRFGLIEAGAALQALSLAAAAAGLAGCVIGAVSGERFAWASGTDPWEASPVAGFALGSAAAGSESHAQ